MDRSSPAQPAPGPGRPVARFGWAVLGMVCVALAGLGVVLPGLPTTVFVLAAAACFSRSSPRLEAWLLRLPGVERLVRDHRAGLGMPRRAKAVALTSIVGFSALAIWTIEASWVRAAVAVLAVVGVAVVAFRVPTREVVLDDRRDAEPTGGIG